MSEEDVNCLICNPPKINSKITGEKQYKCKRCGMFEIPSPFDEIRIPDLLNTETKRVLLSHTIRKMQKPHERIKLSEENVKNILKNGTLPTPPEQADNLILWLGKQTGANFGRATEISLIEIEAIMGAINATGVGAVLDYLEGKKIIGERKRPLANTQKIKLTFDGWEYYKELQRGSTDSKKVFMAMQFNEIGNRNYGLNIMFEEFKKNITIENINFELFRTDEEPKAGSIPDKLIVDILNSRFIIADLTYQNPNVYWEAGYAEALGKPVIYVCEEKFYNERPFDIRHKQTIKWNKDNLNKTIEELKATIRATFPDVAKMQ